MIDLFEAARELEAFCDRLGGRSCFIGGIAVQRWGEPRVTRDVNLNLMAGFGGEDSMLDALLAVYAARIENAREFARRHRVLLLRSSDGDAEGVVLRRKHALDWGYIEDQLRPLVEVKGAPEILDTLLGLRQI